MNADVTYDDRPAASSALATSRRPELLALTSVRFFAALEVVLLHTLFELGGDAVHSIPGTVVDVLTRGGLAVSFFFVLSGFILTYTYSDSDNGLKTTARKFWRARFARIYPIYFLGFLMDAPRAIAFFLVSAGTVVSAVVKIAVAGLAYLTLTQAWHPRVAYAWNTPGWSLSVEALFYVAFPVLLVIMRGWRLRTVCWVAVAIWALPVLAHAVLFRMQIIDLTSVNVQAFWRSFPVLRLPEFVMGVAAGKLFLSGPLDPHHKQLRLLGALAVALILALSVGSRYLPAAVPESTLGAPLFALVILALASGAIPTPNWLNSPVLLLLGRSSYAVYILHQPFKLFFLKLAQLAHFDAPSPALLIAYLVTLQLFCIGLFLWFEDPMRHLLTKPRPS
ncbi:MAG TPA: acyltransferase [Polyangiaceae bacterium]|nr:acyltransferase [Polyangiaceae bacterium]